MYLNELLYNSIMDKEENESECKHVELPRFHKRKDDHIGYFEIGFNYHHPDIGYAFPTERYS